MIITLLILAGIALSAFFSGSETGFYRVTRVRLVMDAKSGNWISLALLWLANHSSVVVATVLIGNNVANYLVSLGLVLASQQLLSGSSEQFQTFVPVLMTPLLFIYGELLPKYLYYKVPYQLLRAGAPMMILCTALFLPVSSIVIALESVWKYFSGTSASKVGITLERQDLQRTLLEGQEAGVVAPLQRELAQNLFTYGVRPVRQFALPLRALTMVHQSATPREVLEKARVQKQKLLGVTDGQHIVGCCVVSDVQIAMESDKLPIIPVCRVLPTDSNIHVLTRLQAMQSPIAYVVDATGKGIGVAMRERLSGLLLSER